MASIISHEMSFLMNLHLAVCLLVRKKSQSLPPLLKNQLHAPHICATIPHSVLLGKMISKLKMIIVIIYMLRLGVHILSSL